MGRCQALLINTRPGQCSTVDRTRNLLVVWLVPYVSTKHLNDADSMSRAHLVQRINAGTLLDEEFRHFHLPRVGGGMQGSVPKLLISINALKHGLLEEEEQEENRHKNGRGGGGGRACMRRKSAIQSHVVSALTKR